MIVSSHFPRPLTEAVPLGISPGARDVKPDEFFFFYTVLFCERYYLLPFLKKIALLKWLDPSLPVPTRNFLPSLLTFRRGAFCRGQPYMAALPFAAIFRIPPFPRPPPRRLTQVTLNDTPKFQRPSPLESRPTIVRSQLQPTINGRPRRQK